MLMRNIAYARTVRSGLSASGLFGLVAPASLGLPFERIARALPAACGAMFDGMVLQADATELFAARHCDGSAALYLVSRFASPDAPPRFPASGATIRLSGEPVTVSRFPVRDNAAKHPLRLLETAIRSRLWEGAPKGASPLFEAARGAERRKAVRFQESAPFLDRAVRAAAGSRHAALLDPEGMGANVFVRCAAEEARTGGCSVAAVSLTPCDPHPRHGPGLTVSLLMPPGLFGGDRQSRSAAELLNRLETFLPLPFPHCGAWLEEAGDTVRYVGFLPESATGILFPRVWEQWARDFCARALWADRIAAREDFRSLVSARL